MVIVPQLAGCPTKMDLSILEKALTEKAATKATDMCMAFGGRSETFCADCYLGTLLPIHLNKKSDSGYKILLFTV